MWTWSLNWGQITDHIVIGTCPMEPDDLRRIHDEAGAAGVLSLQHDDCLAYWGINYKVMCRAGTSLGLVMQRRPIRDFDMADVRRCLPGAILMLANMLVQGHRIYVHCTAGMGRAPVVVLGYLTLVAGYSLDEATRFLLEGRPESVLAWDAYYGCIKDLVAHHRETIERRAYELYELRVHGNADADWFQAQAEILRSVLTQKINE